MRVPQTISFVLAQLNTAVRPRCACVHAVVFELLIETHTAKRTQLIQTPQNLQSALNSRTTESSMRSTHKTEHVSGDKVVLQHRD
jgi:hypothetical protein